MLRASAPCDAQYTIPPIAAANDQNFIYHSSCSEETMAEEFFRLNNFETEFRLSFAMKSK
jgi:hypothetical protein